jgi:hypothetical protein
VQNMSLDLEITRSLKCLVRAKANMAGWCRQRPDWNG